jgi:hypothetical protein
MTIEFLRNRQGKVRSIYVEILDGRNFWMGLSGLGFGNKHGGYNAHYYDLRHPSERYSIGDLRFVHFWKQLWRGLCMFITGREIGDTH